jgi:hypothetical protein
MREMAAIGCLLSKLPVPFTASAAVSASENARPKLPATSCWMFCTEAPVSEAVALTLPPVAPSCSA